MERPDRLIGLILIGNNLVNILASAIATVVALNQALPQKNRSRVNSALTRNQSTGSLKLKAFSAATSARMTVVWTMGAVK